MESLLINYVVWRHNLCRYLISFTLIWLVHGVAYGQSEEIDSLKSLLSESTDLVTKANACNELAWRLRNSNTAAAQVYARRGLSYAQKAGSARDEADAYNRLGVTERTLLDTDSALYYFSRAKIIEEALGNVYGQARSNNQLGTVYRDLHQYKDAKPFFKAAANLFSSLQKLRQEGLALQNLAYCHRLLGDYDSVYQPLERAVQLVNEYGNTRERVHVFLGMGHYRQAIGEATKALLSFNKADSLAQELGDSILLAQVLNAQGHALIGQNEIDSAKPILAEALAIYGEGNGKGKQRALLNMGWIMLLKERYDEAQDYLKRAKALAGQNNDSITIAMALNNLGILAMVGDKPDSAAWYFDQSRQLKGAAGVLGPWRPLFNMSLFLEEQGNLTRALQFRKAYEKELRRLEEKIREAAVAERNHALQKANTIRLEKENQKIKSEKEKRQLHFQVLLATSIALLLLFFGLGAVWVLRRKAILQKREAELAEQKAKLDGEEATKKWIARNIHDELGDLLTRIKLHFRKVEESITTQQREQHFHYEQAFALLGQAVEYSRNIAHNLDPVTLRSFGLIPALKEMQNALDGTNGLRVKLFTIRMEERLSETVERELYLVIQELVRNAIKHAEPKQVTVQLIRHVGSLDVTVEDDGRGFDPEARDAQKGLGMHNVHTRVKALGGTLTIDSRQYSEAEPEIPSGSTFMIEIKL